jgi:hypothetical protein
MRTFILLVTLLTFACDAFAARAADRKYLIRKARTRYAKHQPCLAMARPSADDLTNLVKKFGLGQPVQEPVEKEAAAAPDLRQHDGSLRARLWHAQSRALHRLTKARSSSLRTGRGMLQLVTKRWRTKVVYVATAVVISMVYKRVSRALRLRRLRSGDVYVDADDHEYVNRGTIYEVQMAAVLRQYKQSSELLSSQALINSDNTTITLLQKLDTTVKGVMSVRSSYKRRARYAVELSNSIRQLHEVSEQLREKEALSQQDEDDHLQQHLTVVDSVIILNTVRLADVQLRIVRDTLLATTHECHALIAFWNEKKQQDKRMNFIKSVALKAIHRHKVSNMMNDVYERSVDSCTAMLASCKTQHLTCLSILL